MELNGKVTITRPSGTEEPYVSIEVMDHDSWVEVVEVRMGLEEFAKVLTGQSMVDCTLLIDEVHHNNVGMRREHKTEFVPGSAFDMSEEECTAAVAQFEVDGWRGYYRDFGNGHKSGRVNGVSGYYVGFTRHVPKE